MSSKVIKYNNTMNKVAFNKFHAVELNLFYTICSLLKERGTSELTLSFDELKIYCQTNFRDEKQFIDKLSSTYEKLLGLLFGFEDEERIVKFVLFTHYEILTKEKLLSIKLNEDFSFILNNLTKNFTVFELGSFSKLGSSYSKNLFRLLKQYKSTGFYIATIEEFRRVMDIPEAYRIREIDTRVLKPIKEELPSLFNNLKIEKIKNKGRITHFRISFDAENKEIETNGKIELYNKKVELIKPTYFNCPVCKDSLYEIVGNNGIFYGHKDYANSSCKETYNKESDILEKEMQIENNI